MKLSEPYQEIVDSCRIGSTDLVEFPAPGSRNRIFAKLEYQNHTGSHYDRVYPWLLDQLEREGKIHPAHSILVETTSGNAGISCGFVAQRRGYRTIIFTPAGARPRCNQLMRGYGVDVREVSGADYVADARDAMVTLLREHVDARSGGFRMYYSPNHSQLEISCKALVPIVTEALAQAGGSFDCFIGAAGNGSTLRGMGDALRRDNPKIRMFGFDPAAAPNAYQIKYGRIPGHTPRVHQLFGVGVWDVEFPHLTYAVRQLLEDVMIVEDEQWRQTQLELRAIGYDVGNTSAAAYHLARDFCRRHDNQRILIVFYDAADHY
ncbi:pyridoxal-phosphate dependent enzyme [Patescibacteria group bacterium]|nr:MAG: pyridoxal-phosphate dependent enzyme [Patescibacteria group bacterium]